MKVNPEPPAGPRTQRVDLQWIRLADNFPGCDPMNQVQIPKKLTRPIGWGIGSGIAAAVTVTMGVLTWIGYMVSQGKDNAISNEIKLTALLLIGVMTLLLGLVLAAIAYRAFSIKAAEDEQSHALGLPEGSISAVLALMLVLIFSITTVFLYQNVSNAERNGLLSVGLSQEQVQGFPPERIISTSKQADGTYTVIARNESTASTDFAKTTMATLGTLLVAVVGFYFGSRTSQSSAGKAIASYSSSNGARRVMQGTEDKKLQDGS